MLDIIKRNKVIIGVLVLVIAGFAWYGLSSPEPESVLSSETVDGGDSAAEREVLDTLLQLRAIDLEGQVFNDPAFASLRDFGTDIVDEPIGRRNPFAPLGVVTPTETSDEATTDQSEQTQ